MHATAIVTDPIRHPERVATSIAATCRPPGAARARSAFADGNVDRRAESAEIDIPARHSKDTNVDPVAICLRASRILSTRPAGVLLAEPHGNGSRDGR